MQKQAEEIRDLTVCLAPTALPSRLLMLAGTVLFLRCLQIRLRASDDLNKQLLAQIDKWRVRNGLTLISR